MSERSKKATGEVSVAIEMQANRNVFTDETSIDILKECIADDNYYTTGDIDSDNFLNSCHFGYRDNYRIVKKYPAELFHITNKPFGEDEFDISFTSEPQDTEEACKEIISVRMMNAVADAWEIAKVRQIIK